LANLKGNAISIEVDPDAISDPSARPAASTRRAAAAAEAGQAGHDSQKGAAKTARKGRSSGKTQTTETSDGTGKAGAKTEVEEAQAERRAARKAAAEKSREQGGEPQVIEIRPIAGKARMRSRHWGLLVAFLLMVVVPVSGVGVYLYGVAADQYASSSGFSVRKEDISSPAELMGGLSQFMGGSSGAEADMLFEFIQSQDLVTNLDERLNLREHYTALYEKDPVFGLKPDGTIEDLVRYWHRIVKVS